MNVRITVIGCSPAWPNPGGAHSGYLVESAGSCLLLDCGPGVLARLRQRHLLPIDAIAISHFHLDHWGDLVPWCWLAAHGYGGGASPTLFVPPAGAQMLRQIGSLSGHAAMFDETFPIAEYEPGVPFTAAGLAVTPHRVQHFGLDAYGFRVQEPGGPLLAYSGDSAVCAGLREIARDADVFLCEATLDQPDRDGREPGHLTAAEALEIATGRLLLTHRPDELATPEGAERVADGVTYEI
jgi:ribonuclease BN (tRNA processing enzyme)